MINIKRSTILFLLVFTFSTFTETVFSENTLLSIRFTENNGQIIDDDGRLRPDILYYIEGNNVKSYLTTKGIIYAWIQNENSEPDKKESFNKTENIAHMVNSYSMEMELINSNPNVKIIPENEYEDYTNYYLAHCPKGITNVKSYKKLTYSNIYKNIDLVLYSVAQKGLKYDFIVRPGGNINDIQFTYKGSNTIQLSENGDIIITNPMGSILEEKPYTFQNHRDKQKTIRSKFKTQKGIISFEIAEYDKTKALVIDPSVSWASFYGGTDDDWILDLCLDENRYSYITGVTESSSGISSSGSEQSSRAGNYDAFVARFSSTGVRIWATYYGGSNDDGALAICIDPNSAYVYIAGNTTSTDLDITTGYYHFANVGGGDGFIAKFGANGQLSYGSYFGGSGYDGVSDLCIDTEKNFYVVGTTESSNFFGDFNYMKGGGDGYCMKFDENENFKWGKFVGGTGLDYGNAVTTDPSGNVFIAGETQSTDVATSGAFQTTNLGNNAFLVKYNSSGTKQWATYFGGTYSEAANAICSDDNGNIYMTGEARSSGLATTGAYQSSISNMDAFLVKFSNSGKRKWSTYYGGSGNESALGIATSGEYIYMTGYTSSSSSIASSNAPQESYAGWNDCFISKFNSVGNFLWGTYYGSYGVDWSYAIATSESNTLNATYVYIAGFSRLSPTLPYTSDGYQTYHAGSNYEDQDGFFVKVKDEFNIKATFKTSNEIFNSTDSIMASNDMEVYPNPTNGLFYISVNSSDTINTLEIYNIYGKRILNIDTPSFSNTIPLDFSHLTKGTYLIVSRLNNRVISKKILLN